MFISGDTPDIETSTDAYAGRFAGPVGTWLLDKQWDAVWGMLNNCAGNRVLEIGGGHAQLTGALLERGYDVTTLGSDISCADRLKPFLKHERSRFHVGSLTSLPYADDSFDIVIAIRLMAHMDHWQDMLKEAARVGKHAVIIDYPSVYSVNRMENLLFGLKKKIEGNTRPYRCFTADVIDKTCRPYNLAYAGRQRQFFLPMVLHRMMKQPGLSAFLENCCRRIGLTYMLGSPVVLKLARTHPTSAPLNRSQRPDNAAQTDLLQSDRHDAAAVVADSSPVATPRAPA